MFNRTILLCSIYFLSVLTSFSATAAIVDHNAYLTDTKSNLDWLDVTTTINKSYNEVSLEITQGGELAGWRYATGKEFNNLIEHVTGAAPSSNLLDASPLSSSDAFDLIKLLGSTLDAYCFQYHGMTCNSYQWSLGNYNISDQYTYGLLSDGTTVTDGASKHLALIERYFNFNTGDHIVVSIPYANSIGTDARDYYFGSYLVRDTQNQPNEVSAPNTILLCITGLLLVGISRQQKNIR